MTLGSDEFILMLDEYLKNKIRTGNKMVSCLRMPNSEYETVLKNFYNYLIQLNLYDVILLHYVNQTTKNKSNDEQDFELEKKILNEIMYFNTKTSTEENLLSFCENFEDTYDGLYRNVKSFTSSVCCYISRVIYGLDLPLAEQDNYLNNKQNFTEIVNTVSENIKINLQKKNVVNGYDCPINVDEEISRILPCALYMFGDTIYTLTHRLSEARESFLEFYEEYVLPNFNKCVLLTNYQNRNAIIVFVFKRYYDFFQDSLQPYDNLFDNYDEFVYKLGTEEELLYDEENLYNESLNIGDTERKYANGKLLEFSKKRKKLFDLFLKCITKECFKVYKVDEHQYFSSVLTNSIIYLYFSGKKYDARNYLCKWYNSIDVYNKNRNLFFVFLVRCIKECNNYETASVLLSLYIRDFIPSFEKVVLSLTKQMTECVCEAKNIAEEAYNGSKLYQKLHKTLVEKVYRNEQLTVFLNKCKDSVNDKRLLNKNDYKRLRNIYRQFSNERTDIDVGIMQYFLGWNDEYFNCVCEENYNYDKIPDMDEVRAYFRDKYISKSDEVICEIYYSGKGDVRRLVGYELQEHIYLLQIKTIVEENKKLQAEKDKMLDMFSEEELSEWFPEFEKKCELFNKSLMNINGKPCLAKYLAILNNSQRSFLKVYTDSKTTSKKLISQKLDDKTSAIVMEYLSTSYIIYNVLCDVSKEASGIDFSPACLSLTKALEMILGNIWNVTKNEINTDSICDNSKKYYCYNDKKDSNKYKIKKSLELGSYAKMFKEEWFIASVDKTKAIDFSKLNNMTDCFYSDIKLPVESNVLTFKKGENDKNIAATISEALSYVTKKFRNKVAHKEPFERTSADECREYLISTQQLLWILLYIMRDK